MAADEAEGFTGPACEEEDKDDVSEPRETGGKRDGLLAILPVPLGDWMVG